VVDRRLGRGICSLESDDVAAQIHALAPLWLRLNTRRLEGRQFGNCTLARLSLMHADSEHMD